MVKATSLIEHGVIDENGKNLVLTFQPGDSLSILPEDVVARLIDLKCAEHEAKVEPEVKVES